MLPQLENMIGSNGVSDADNSLPPSGQALSQALKSLVATFDAQAIRYAIIGGIATIQHTRVRTTSDVDALLSVSQIAMPAMFDALQACGFTVDLQKNLRELRNDGLTSIRYGEVLVDLLRPVLPVFSRVLESAVQLYRRITIIFHWPIQRRLHTLSSNIQGRREQSP